MTRLSRSAPVDLRFTLSTATKAPVAVAVRLRGGAGRWVAFADSGLGEHAGVGGTPRQALTAALGTLHPTVVTLLLADLALLEPSCAVLADQRAASG